MSENYLKLVPVDPEWRPTPEAADRAVEMLSHFAPKADEICGRFEKTVIFFDAGGNTESISCPACGREISDWWGDAMDNAWKSSFTDLVVDTPCCKTSTSLNDLQYDWPAAFGRFALEARNPGISALSKVQHQALEDCLGSRLRVIWQHL